MKKYWSKIRWRWGFLLQRVLALVMVEKAGLGKHCRSREVKGFGGLLMVGHGLEKKCSFRKIAMTMKEELLMVALGLQVKMEVCG